MNKKKIFIAVDTNNIPKAKKIINDTQTNKIRVGYKFGLEFFLLKRWSKIPFKIKKSNNFP